MFFFLCGCVLLFFWVQLGILSWWNDFYLSLFFDLKGLQCMFYQWLGVLLRKNCLKGFCCFVVIFKSYDFEGCFIRVVFEYFFLM